MPHLSIHFIIQGKNFISFLPQYTRGVISGDPKIIAILCESLDSNFPCILTEGLNILCVIAIIPKGLVEEFASGFKLSSLQLNDNTHRKKFTFSHKLILQAFKKLHVDDHGLQRFQFITNLLRSTNNDDVAVNDIRQL